jgi:hypothetical protein
VEAESIGRTYLLRRETAQRVKDLASARGVGDSSLVDLLLTHALDDVDAGRLTFTRRPVAWVIDRGNGQE